MDAIKTYLETMLSKLPQTEESFRLKNELLISMEEKYSELKAAGKSENEAIGTVISEFGNIEELVEEVGAASEADGNEDVPEIDLFTVQGFLAQLKETSLKTAAGVFMVMAGMAALLGFMVIGDVFTEGTTAQIGDIILGVVIFAVLLAIGVGLLVSAWLKFLKYDFIYKSFRLSEHVRQYVKNVREKSMHRNITFIAAGVTIIVLSTIAVIIPAIVYSSVNPIITGVAIFLAATGLGTAPIIIAGLSIAFVNMLMGITDEDEWFGSGIYIGSKGIKIGNDIRIDNEGINIGAVKIDGALKTAKIVGVAGAVFWPLLIAAYLLWSFLGEAWSISWILFVMGALIFGAFSGGVGAYYNIDKK